MYLPLKKILLPLGQKTVNKKSWQISTPFYFSPSKIDKKEGKYGIKSILPLR
jgi:hypothetical protein